MQLKSFIDKDKDSLKKRVSSFLNGATKLSVLNVKYDVNYATREWRAIVYYVKMKV